LRKLGFAVLDSQSNFVLATVPGKSGDGAGEAERIYLALKDQGILVRYFKQEDRLQDKLRITIGSPEDNQRLLDALAEL
jgi:histidinol-phosphate aminotransferase